MLLHCDSKPTWCTKMAPVVDDLYAGLTLPKNSKRDEAPAKDHARVDSDGNGADATGVEKKRARDVQQQNDAKRQKRADKPLDLQETVTKLKGYMVCGHPAAYLSEGYC